MTVEHVVGPSLRELYVLGNTLTVVLIAVVAGRKAILAGLVDRAETVAKQLVGTQQELVQIKKELDTIKKEGADISQLQKKLISESEVEAQHLARQILKDAETTAQRIIEDAKQSSTNDLKSAGNSLRQILVQDTLDLAVQSVRKDHLDVVHSKLVDSFVDQQSVVGV